MMVIASKIALSHVELAHRLYWLGISSVLLRLDTDGTHSRGFLEHSVFVLLKAFAEVTSSGA
jgi:hypothetical protein